MAAVALALAATVTGLPVQEEPADAQIAQCTISPEGHCTVWHGVPIPGGRGTPGRPGGGDYVEPVWPCLHTWQWYDAADQSQLRVHFPYAPAGAILQWRHCNRDPDNEPVDRWDYRYIVPGAPPLNRPPTPEEVAWWLRFGVDAFMYRPQLAADPAIGTPSFVTLPTFIAVTNWQGRIHLRDCRWSFGCVELIADAELTFRPGEPGSGSVDCNDDAPAGPGVAGTRFDPNNPASPRDQAAGVCSYAYQRHTGSTGPQQWRGLVVETWHVSWSTPGDSGVFAPIVLSTPLSRDVDELQAVVTETEIGPNDGD